MKISKLVVVCAALAMGATLMADSNSNQIVVAPSQGAGGMATLRIESPVLKGQPYSADVENESVQTLSDGNKIVRKTTGRVYRDTEGRVRREDDQPNGGMTVTISDPVAGMSWTLNTATKTARESSLSTARLAGAVREMQATLATPTGERPTAAAGGVARGGGGGGRGVGAGGGVSGGGATRVIVPTEVTQRAGGVGIGAGGRGGERPGTDRVEEALPNKSIENLLCTGVRRTTTIAKGLIGNEQPIKIVSEEWKSVDLQVLVLTDLNDPRTGRSTYKLSNVRRADPDLSLFKVPADYTITRGGGRGGN